MTHAQDKALKRWVELGYVVTDERADGLRHCKYDVVCVKDNPLSSMYVVVDQSGNVRTTRSVWRE